VIGYHHLRGGGGGAFTLHQIGKLMSWKSCRSCACNSYTFCIYLWIKTSASLTVPVSKIMLWRYMFSMPPWWHSHHDESRIAATVVNHCPCHVEVRRAERGYYDKSDIVLSIKVCFRKMTKLDLFLNSIVSTIHMRAEIAHIPSVAGLSGDVRQLCIWYNIRMIVKSQTLCMHRWQRPIGEEAQRCISEPLQLWFCIHRGDEESPWDPEQGTQSSHQKGGKRSRHWGACLETAAWDETKVLDEATTLLTKEALYIRLSELQLLTEMRALPSQNAAYWAWTMQLRQWAPPMPKQIDGCTVYK